MGGGNRACSGSGHAAEGGGEALGSSAAASAAAAGCAAGDAGGPGGSDPLGSRYVLVFTMVLPDGLGDLIFGESAVHELAETELSVAWFRCYSSEEGFETGERLVRDTAGSVAFSFASRSRDGLRDAVGADRLEEMWRGAQERFLAPWIFGLSQADEDALLDVAERSGAGFFALTEYGRSMGNIHTYTRGLGAMVPTGWVVDSSSPGGVFKSILRAPRTDVDWKASLAEKCGLSAGTPVRLWWFYSRKDDEKKHDFRVLDRSAADDELHVLAKVVPVSADGSPLLGHEKTSGEKLAEQLFEAANDPTFKPTTDVALAEVAAGLAGQLSQFLWGILFDEMYTQRSSTQEEGVVDIIVAPNVLTSFRKTSSSGFAAARIPQLDLVTPGSTSRQELHLTGRRVFMVSTKVPRAEMRTFLEQCEQIVYTTGDQSLAEAILLEKFPSIKPDAKVNQWQLALAAFLMGKVGDVPDLGEALRQLALDEPGVRERTRQESRRRSDELERHMVAELGGPPETWSATHQVLARAGMLG